MTDPKAAARDLVPHGLGQPRHCRERIVIAAVRALRGAPTGWVELRELGDAMVEPVPGAEFDPDDAVDRDLLVTVLVRWRARLARRGVEFGVPDLAAGRVRAERCPRRGDDQTGGWSEIARRAVLARWAERAADAAVADEPGPDAMGDAPLSLADVLRGRDTEHIRDRLRLPVIDARPVWIGDNLVLLPVRPTTSTRARVPAPARTTPRSES